VPHTDAYPEAVESPRLDANDLPFAADLDTVADTSYFQHRHLCSSIEG
jgi:hypothetical protein